MMTRYATAFLFLLFLCAGMGPDAGAQTTRYVATDGDDVENDCTSAANPCATVQHAVDQASDTANDVIEVAAGTYNEVSIFVDDKTLTIQGESAATTIIDAQGSGRILEVGGISDVTLQDLTLRNGADFSGGAVLVDGTLTVDRMVFESNEALSGEGSTDGGAIFASFATLTISSSTFDANTASGDGGAIFADGSDVTITGSTFTTNSAELGGAIRLEQSSDGGTATLTNNTFSANESSAQGGALSYMEFSDGSISVQFNTFIGNTASPGGGALHFEDAGSSGTLFYGNSIFGANTSPSIVRTGVQGTGTLSSQGYNVLDDTSGDFNTNDQRNTDPQLDALADNGGETQTMRPLMSSPVLDAGNCDAVAQDQRGETRPYDHPELPNEAGGDGCDAGAVELQADEYVNATRYVATGGDDAENDCADPGAPCATVAHAVAVAAPGDAIEVAAGTYTESGITLEKNLTITGAGAATTTVQAASEPGIATDRIFWVDDGVTADFSDLTLSNGVASGASGGGIFARLQASLNVTRCVFRGHRATAGEGGGNGGAIFAANTLSIQDSFFEDNQSSNADGGAVFSSGDLSVTGSTFLNNSAVNGGALFTSSFSGQSFKSQVVTQAFQHNTFVQNEASASGGAIFFEGLEDDLDVTSSTFAENTAATSGGAIHFERVEGGIVTYSSSIFDQNTPENISVTDNAQGPDPLQSQGYNLLSDASGDPDPPSTDQLNTFADLAPLADNGGETPTRLPQSTSPALDAGGFCSADTDQRGEQRTVDLPLLPNAVSGCDVGAVELQEAEFNPATRYVATDGDDASGENDCADPNTPCATIENALSYASNGETIRIFGGTYTESGLDVGSSVLILGDGPGETIVQAAAQPGTASDRVFTIEADVTVEIRDLTVQHGVASTGGGILSDGQLTIDNVDFFQNQASEAGGAVDVTSWQFTVTGSVFEENSVTGATGRGGGVRLVDGAIVASTFLRNSANEGGGVAFDGSSENSVYITNSTFSQNTAASSGGGVHYLSDGFSSMWIHSTTFYFNEAPEAASLGAVGNAQSGQIDLANSIFAATGSNFGAAPSPVITSVGANLYTDNPPFSFGSDQVDTDPLLLPLVDNGGPTPTHLPLGISPAIDQGSCTDGPTVDQRGETRPFDDPDTPNLNEGCDVGAVEVQAGEFMEGADLNLTKTVDNAEPVPGGVVTFTLTLTNEGTLDAHDVVVTDQFAGGLTFLGATPEADYDPATGEWTIGTLPVASSVTLEIEASGDRPGHFTNQAEVTQAVPLDPDSTPDNGDPEEDDYAETTVTVIAPAASVTPPILRFGEMAVGAEVTETVTVTNTGTATLQVNSREITGPNRESFQLAAGKSYPPVPPGGTFEVEVTFAPTSGGEKVATLLINTSVGIVSAGLRGTAVGPTLAVAPTSLPFGSVAPGVAVERTLTLSNTGSGPLTITSLSIDGEHADAFSVVEGGDVGTIEQGGSADLGLSFQALEPGDKEAVLHLESDGGTVTVALQGRVLTRRIAIQPTTLDFGPFAVGADAQATVTIRNDGDVPLDLQSASVAGAASEDFEAAGQTGALAPDEEFRYLVSFTPSVPGAREAELVLTFAGETVPVPLRGEGIESDPERSAAVTPEAIDFGDVPAGETATREVEIQNTGAAPIAVSDVRIEGPEADAFTAGDAPDAVPVDASAALSVSFTAGAPGTYAAELVLETNAGTFRVPLSATVPEEAALTLSASSVDFGEVFVGATAERTVQLTNTGGTALTLSSVTIAGGEAFAVDSRPETISAGASQDVVLLFTPQEPGAHEATLQIDAATANDATVSLSGAGTLPALSVSVTPDPAQRGEPVTVTVSAPGDFTPGQGQLFYRPGGSTSFASTSLDVEGGAFSGVIPGGAVTERGVDYYVQLTEGSVTGTFPTEQAEQVPAHLRVRVESLPTQRTFTARQYAIVAPSLLLDDPDPGSVFGDDYGLPYDPDRWRLLRWDPPQEGYDEFPDLPSFTPGTAFWLVTNDGASYDLGPGVSIDASVSAPAANRSEAVHTPQQMTLLPGWNLIGVFFPFDVSWDVVDRPASVQAPQAWNPDTEAFEPNQPVLERERGYFVLNQSAEPVTITVPPEEASEASKTEDPPPLWAAAEYAVQLVARLPAFDLVDAQNVVGLSAEAREGRDPLDVGEPPPVGDHVRLSVVNAGRPTPPSERLAVSLKPSAGEGQHWDLELTAAMPSERYVLRKEVTLQLVEHGARPEGYRLYVLDMDRGVPLATGDAAGGLRTLTLSGERPSVRLRVLLGTEQYAEANNEGVLLEATETLLEAPYPNPFNPETVIGYRLREPEQVVLEIYDALGRQVRQLVAREQAAGRHEVVWDARDDAGRQLASGIYFCRMQAGSYVATRTLTLVR